jgi:hypothetical protein
MSSAYFIKRNDTKGTIECNLLDGDSTAVDLTGATVKFLMRREGRSGVKVNSAASVVGDPAAGVVSYQWEAADTDTAGDYEGEFEVTFSDGRVATFPSDGYVPVTVLADVR